jgi:hypothetical protein
MGGQKGNTRFQGNVYVPPSGSPFVQGSNASPTKIHSLTVSHPISHSENLMARYHTHADSISHNAISSPKPFLTEAHSLFVGTLSENGLPSSSIEPTLLCGRSS